MDRLEVASIIDGSCILGPEPRKSPPLRVELARLLGLWLLGGTVGLFYHYTASFWEPVVRFLDTVLRLFTK